MNTLDIIIALPLIYFIFRGWKKGLVVEIATLAGIVAGAYAALHFSKWVAGVIGLDGDKSVLTAFFITFVGVLALAFLLGKLIEGLLKISNLSFINRLAGAAVGMAKGICIVSILLGWVVLIDRHELLLTAETKSQSALFKPTMSAGGGITNRLKTFVNEQRCKIVQDSPEK